VTGFLQAALEFYGQAVLASAEAGGGDSAAELGYRLIWEILGGEDAARSLRAVLAEPAGRQQDDAATKLHDWVSNLLEADPATEAAAAELMSAFYEREFEAGRADAMVDLGDLLLAQGRRPEALAAYRKAVDRGHLHALIPLARLHYDERRDAVGAKAAYQEAIDAVDPDVSAEALVLLGYQLARPHRDYAAAMEAFSRAIETGHPHWSLAGLRGQAYVLEQQGDLDGARAIYQQVTDAEDAGQAAQALVSLGKLLESQGDAVGAKAAYWRVLDSTAASWAAHGLTNLVNLLEREGDLDGAQAAYGKAMETRNRDAPYALAVIGQLLEARGDTAAARAAYEQSAEAGCELADHLLAEL